MDRQSSCDLYLTKYLMLYDIQVETSMLRNGCVYAKVLMVLSFVSPGLHPLRITWDIEALLEKISWPCFTLFYLFSMPVCEQVGSLCCMHALGSILRSWHCMTLSETQ
jgi:hypothetical protein